MGGSTTDGWAVTGPQTIDVEGITAIDATIMNGRLDVVAHDEPGVRVEIHSLDGRPLEVRVEGGTLKVGYTFPAGGWKGFVDKFLTYNGRDRADVYIGVPVDVAVRLKTVRGDGLVAGTRGKASVATVAGSVMTTQTAGQMRVDSVSGEVTVRDHVGSLTMESVSGDLTASGALDDVRLHSVSGAVMLDSGVTPGSVSVNAVSGDVLVRVPDPDALDYSVRCVSGRLIVDGVEHRGVAGGTLRQAGPDGGGQVRPLRVNTVSGNVTVLRAGGVDGIGLEDADDVLTDDRPSWGSSVDR